MKRSISPEPFSFEKSLKLFHYPPDDGGAGVSSHHLPVTSSDLELFLLNVYRYHIPFLSQISCFHIIQLAVGDRTQKLKDAWDLLKPAINIILDDSFSFKSSGDICCNRTLWDVGQELFHKQLSAAPQLQYQVFAGILGLITAERLGKTDCNTTLLKNLMDMFFGLWPNTFGQPFLDSTSKFYAEEAERVLQHSDISQYLKYVEGCFLAEEEKCDKHYFFFAASRTRLMKVLASQLLEAHVSFFEEGFKVLMDEGRMDDLRRMYRLFSRADLVVYIDRMLRSYILAEEDGAGREGSWHELHTRIDKIWHESFDEDDLLDRTIRGFFGDRFLNVLGDLNELLGWK